MVVALNITTAIITNIEGIPVHSQILKSKTESAYYANATRTVIKKNPRLDLMYKECECNLLATFLAKVLLKHIR